MTPAPNVSDSLKLFYTKMLWRIQEIYLSAPRQKAKSHFGLYSRLVNLSFIRFYRPIDFIFVRFKPAGREYPTQSGSITTHQLPKVSKLQCCFDRMQLLHVYSYHVIAGFGTPVAVTSNRAFWPSRTSLSVGVRTNAGISTLSAITLKDFIHQTHHYLCRWSQTVSQ